MEGIESWLNLQHRGCYWVSRLLVVNKLGGSYRFKDVRQAKPIESSVGYQHRESRGNLQRRAVAMRA